MSSIAGSSTPQNGGTCLNTPRSSITMLPEVPRSTEAWEADEKRSQGSAGGDIQKAENATPGTANPLSAIFNKTPDPNMVTWDGPDDPANPLNWSVRRRWIISIAIFISTLNVSFASSSPIAATAGIVKFFGISLEVSYLMTTVFLLGFAFGPILWGPGSEMFGRRMIYIGTLWAYTLFIIGQPLAKNIETLIITRFLSGFFAASPMTNSGGILVDIWDPVRRGMVTSIFTTTVFLGPVLGPIVSGAIIQRGLYWTWVFWVMFIFAVVSSAFVTLVLPETYEPVLLRNKLRNMRKEDPKGTTHLFAEHEKQDWSFKGVMERTLLRPFIMLVTEPILLLVTLYISLVYGVLYCMFQALPIIFHQKRDFNVFENGLVFIGVGIGAVLASIINHLLGHRYTSMVQKWRGFPPAEERLLGAMVGAPAFVIGIFWLGWTGNYDNIHWAVPAVSTIFVGLGVVLIFMSSLTYLVDTYLMFTASAFAANTIVRSAVAAAFPLFTTQMFQQMTVKWAATLLGLVGLLLAPSPFLFYKYGPRIRENSKFAPCIDLKIAKMMAQNEKQGEV